MSADIAIVIPTKGRPQLLFPLVWNIAKTTPAGAFQIYFVVNKEDVATRHTIRGFTGPVHLVLTEEHGYPKAANVGFNATNERLVAIVNDDVKFHDGWWDELRKVLTPDVQVIAPNDLSPQTEGGAGCTQPIVRRSYIMSPGGAWGERGTVYHEGYQHLFTDTELWQLAQQRGVAKFADNCVIEHLHPDWQKAELDDTYRNGSARRGVWEHDEALYIERQAGWQR
jgi:GT2 family glycosyltransferase